MFKKILNKTTIFLSVALSKIGAFFAEIYFFFSSKNKAISNWYNSMPKKKRYIFAFTLLTFLMLLIATLLIFVDTLTGANLISIWFVRLPKMPVIFIMGIGTSIAGLLLQKITRNHLTDTGLMGISNSGVFFMSLITVFFPGFSSAQNNPLLTLVAIPLVVSASALITMLLMYFLSFKRGVSPNRIVLMGIGVGMLFTAGTTVVTYYGGGYEMHFINRYLVGWIEVKQPILYWSSLAAITICTLIAWILGKKLDILESSEQVAKSVGIRVELLKMFVFVLIAVLVGATASVVGSVSLLGLMAPAIARSMFKNNSRVLIPATAMIGVIFVMLSQFININIFHIAAPIGIMIQVLIAPYFLYRVFSVRRD